MSVSVCACASFGRLCARGMHGRKTPTRARARQRHRSERPRDAASAYGKVRAACDFMNASPAAQNGESRGFGGGWCVNERKCGNPWFPPAHSSDAHCEMTLRSAAARPVRLALRLVLQGKRCVIRRLPSVACRGCMFDCVRGHRVSPWTCAPQRRHSWLRHARCAPGVAWRVVFHAESGRHAHYHAAHRRQTRPGTRVGSGSRRANCPASGTPSAPPPPSAVGRIRSVRIATGGCEYPVSTR